MTSWVDWDSTDRDASTPMGESFWQIFKGRQDALGSRPAVGWEYDHAATEDNGDQTAETSKIWVPPWASRLEVDFELGVNMSGSAPFPATDFGEVIVELRLAAGGDVYLSPPIAVRLGCRVAFLPAPECLEACDSCDDTPDDGDGVLYERTAVVSIPAGFARDKEYSMSWTVDRSSDTVSAQIKTDVRPWRWVGDGDT